MSTTMQDTVTEGVIGVFDTLDEAEATIRRMGTEGYPIEELSIVGRDVRSETAVHGFITTGDVTKTGAGAGAWVGGIFGLLTGAALLVVPGVGPLFVAGPLVASLLGGVEGAVVGGAAGGGLGAVIGHFVAARHIPKYEQHLEAGRYLVVATGSGAALERAQRLISDHSDDVVRHDAA